MTENERLRLAAIERFYNVEGNPARYDVNFLIHHISKLESAIRVIDIACSAAVCDEKEIVIKDKESKNYDLP